MQNRPTESVFFFASDTPALISEYIVVASGRNTTGSFAFELI